MNSARKNTRLLLGILLTAGLSAPVMAQTVADVDSQASGTAATVNDNAIVTAVLSSNATESTYLLQDSTGAIEGFDIPDAGDNGANPASNPVVGDIVNLSGAFEPFHELPEIETKSGVATASETIVSTGNPAPADITYTVVDLQNGSTAGGADLLEIGDLDNVTFVETGDFTTANENSNEDFEVTDGSLIGQVFISSSSPLFNTPIPTSPVDIHGYLSIFASTPDTDFEFDLLGANPITVIPEPASIGLLAAGATLLLRRKARKA
jgi:hypothetical protein